MKLILCNVLAHTNKNKNVPRSALLLSLCVFSTIFKETNPRRTCEDFGRLCCGTSTGKFFKTQMSRLH